MSELYYPLTEHDVNYGSVVGTGSVDGPRDLNVLDLTRELIGVNVLEMAAGDGRYSIPLLISGNDVFAGDKIQAPLQATRSKLTGDLAKQYHPVQFDAFGAYPFPDNTFQGLVCTGFLYLFPEEMLRATFSEFDRVLEPGSPLVFDFATGIRREKPDGTLVRGSSEIDYSLAEGYSVISKVLHPNFVVERRSVSEIKVGLYEPGQPGYEMTNTKINILARKL